MIQYFQDYYVELFYYKPWPHAIRNFYIIWATILLGFWIPLMDDQFWNNGEPYNRLISALYYPFCRLIWTLCIALMIWCCLSGNGGLVNRLLSWKAFVPLARLTYSVYLTHAWIVWIFYSSRRERIDLNSFSLLLIFSHNLLMSYIIGIIFSVVFEMPCIKLNNYLLKYLKLSADKNERRKQLVPKFHKIEGNTIDFDGQRFCNTNIQLK
ncbi:unnamed protein product [Medioppia subpectinata]|uniref:Acyltransferase 3 domain-containing protein n=1 Tax=Medioppia subpectinata TaxID=1979941 RepID=A0A7R9PZ37_9ACAR|nr:unnamed protein product [Medioppia subpectinata]CAG2105807.1 unnamed protein product [Medioppia subpectinata]